MQYIGGGGIKYLFNLNNFDVHLKTLSQANSLT